MIVLAIIMLSSCVKNYKEIEEEPYPSIFRVDQINVQISMYGIEIKPVCAEFDKEFDTQSREFYSSLDTSLTYTGKVSVKKFNGGFREKPSAIDWRFNSIEIFTLEDFDPKHPAGSSLNDLCQIWYRYKHALVIRPLSDVRYGTLMLTDYYPYNEGFGETIQIYLYDSSVDIPKMKVYPEYKKFTYQHPAESAFPKVEVRITDAFGNEYTANN